MAAFFRGFPLTPSFSCRLSYWYIDTAPGTYLRQVSIGDEMSNILWKRFYQLNMLAIPKITMVQLGSCFLWSAGPGLHLQSIQQLSVSAEGGSKMQRAASATRLVPSLSQVSGTLIQQLGRQVWRTRLPWYLCIRFRICIIYEICLRVTSAVLHNQWWDVR